MSAEEDKPSPPASSKTASPDDTKPAVSDDVSLTSMLRTILIGAPRNLEDKTLFKHLSLVAFLAWVGLGADGLSSSCYGPAEAFHALGSHSYLAVFLAVATIATVLIISRCYSHIIEVFPSGGGGYVVASKLLGRRIGLVSGCALLVDYVLTITVSIAAAGDALFGLMDPSWNSWKLPAEFGAILILVILNLRGVKESVLMLLPIFLLFLLTHIVLIFGAVLMHLGSITDVSANLSRDITSSLRNPEMGFFGLATLLLYAYSLGAGTYTGIEAVSNSMPVMREPRVVTGKRTMLLMAVSLAITAGGLILSYLLLHISWKEGQTMNQTLTEAFVGELRIPSGAAAAFVLVTMISEGALLVVAAQAGFIDGPRVLANMALDSWVPHWFASLSERLTTHNGILLLGGSALAALWYTEGNVATLVLMYSINVFLTFSLSMIAMCRYWWKQPRKRQFRRRRLALFVVGAILCSTILAITITEKFLVGGWVTLAVTGSCVGLCLLTNRYYRRVTHGLSRLNEQLDSIPKPAAHPNVAPLDPNQPTAVILVGGYGGLGVHTFLNVQRFAPGYFKNLIFISVGTVDSGVFKGEEALEDLRRHTAESLERYVKLARELGVPAASYMSIGADVVDELENLCTTIAKQYPRSTFFAGQLVFQRDSWYQHLLHNQTAFALQRRLQWLGLPMVILPTRVR
jgi:amino acid transporter